MTAQPDPYRIVRGTPTANAYRALRLAAGLSDKSPAAAERGLAASLFAVQLIADRALIGMGRVIGDGGCFFQVVDIAVEPGHQGRGLGKTIMREIMAWLSQNAPPTSYVSLIADGPAKDLYTQFGFVPTAPASIGMAWRPKAQVVAPAAPP